MSKNSIRNKTTHIVLHCSATKNSATFVGFKQINEWHKARFSPVCLCDTNIEKYSNVDLNQRLIYCGYHYIIKKDGNIEMGRPHDLIGVHAKGYNSRSVGICIVGTGEGKSANGFSDDLYGDTLMTDDQKVSLALILEQMQTLYNVPDSNVIGHVDTYGNNPLKDCPTFDVQSYMKRNV